MNTPEYWRERAEASRAIAEGMKDPKSRQTLFDIAKGYDSLAKQAERWEATLAAAQRTVGGIVSLQTSPLPPPDG